MTKVRFMRRNNVILDVRSVEDRTVGIDEESKLPIVEPCAQPVVLGSINQAKKKSIELQKKYGPGCLRVDKDAVNFDRPIRRHKVVTNKSSVKKTIHVGPRLSPDDAASFLAALKLSMNTL